MPPPVVLKCNKQQEHKDKCDIRKAGNVFNTYANVIFYFDVTFFCISLVCIRDRFQIFSLFYQLIKDQAALSSIIEDCSADLCSAETSSSSIYNQLLCSAYQSIANLVYKENPVEYIPWRQAISACRKL